MTPASEGQSGPRKETCRACDWWIEEKDGSGFCVGHGAAREADAETCDLFEVT
jgi:hypothetical protein